MICYKKPFNKMVARNNKKYQNVNMNIWSPNGLWFILHFTDSINTQHYIVLLSFGSRQTWQGIQHLLVVLKGLLSHGIPVWNVPVIDMQSVSQSRSELCSRFAAIEQTQRRYQTDPQAHDFMRRCWSITRFIYNFCESGDAPSTAIPTTFPSVALQTAPLTPPL